MRSMNIPEISLKTNPSLVAALLLLVRELLPEWVCWPRTALETLALVGASKSQAYEMLGRLKEILPTLLGAPGRPVSQKNDSNDLLAVTTVVRDYVIDHPGAV